MKLPEKPSQIELNEDIFKFIQDNNLFGKVKEFNKKHLYWDEVKHRLSNIAEQKPIWSLMKFFRLEKYESIPILNLKYIISPAIMVFLQKCDQSLAGNIETQTSTLGLEKKYIVSSLMEEAIASSMIEGAATTRKEAKKMLKEKRKPVDISEHMVVNGYETMQMITSRKNEKLTPEFLLEIQANITKNTLKDGSDVGKFRDNNDVVVGDDSDPDLIYHIPPDFHKVKSLIEEVCLFANNDSEDFIHPIIKGIALHFLIGYIHPFNDGNGRTARSVFYWYVLSKGYWLFEYMAVSRRIYRSKSKYGLAYLYTEYDDFDLTYFIKYNLQAINEAIDDLLKYIELKKNSTTKVYPKLNYRQSSILRDITSDKKVTIKSISTSYGIAYETARTDLMKIYSLGYAKMIKEGKELVFLLS
ncbi:Fic family protein [Candidatus Woesearchaeota archaeon]|nr:Fic family protein [Candidatus Woesearchaeota archaeon]